MHLEIVTHAPRGPARSTAVVFVHGAWHGLWCWEQHFLPFFAEAGYTAIAFDLRGHGKSENRRSLRFTRVDDYVSDLQRVVEGLDAAPVLVGHSMGGLIVQRYLEDRRAAAAILLAPDPVGGAIGATLRVARRHPLAFAKANATLSLWPVVATPELARDAFFADDMPEAVSDRYWSHLQNESYLAYLDMLAFRRPRPDRVATPTLVIGAGFDGVFTAAEMDRTARAYGTEPVMIEGAAHDLMLDARWMEMAEAIRDWLAPRHGSAPG
jgi:pimeloyl-ACP methyl ester carboxylesterase